MQIRSITHEVLPSLVLVPWSPQPLWENSLAETSVYLLQEVGDQVSMCASFRRPRGSAMIREQAFRTLRLSTLQTRRLALFNTLSAYTGVAVRNATAPTADHQKVFASPPTSARATPRRESISGACHSNASYASRVKTAHDSLSEWCFSAPPLSARREPFPRQSRRRSAVRRAAPGSRKILREPPQISKFFFDDR